jgi:hypothetical protein
MEAMKVDVVPNDIFATPQQRLHVLTGENPRYHEIFSNVKFM